MCNPVVLTELKMFANFVYVSLPWFILIKLLTISGFQWPHFCHSSGLHLRDRQGCEALHQPAQGRRNQANDRRGEGQEAYDQVKLLCVAVSLLLDLNKSYVSER